MSQSSQKVFSPQGSQPCYNIEDLTHKIRNSLTAIQSSVELLDIYGQSITDEQRLELLSSIHRAVRQIENDLPE